MPVLSSALLCARTRLERILFHEIVSLAKGPGAGRVINGIIGS